MSLNINKWYKRIASFWVINISGWILLTFIYLLLYYPSLVNEPKNVYGLLLNKFTGFLCSIALRYFYKKINYKSYSIIKLVLGGVIISLVASHVWFVLDFIISIPLHSLEGLIDSYFIFNVYLRTIWSGFFTLYFWSTLYFVIKFWLEWTEQKKQTEQAILLAQNAQLQMLRYQVNPHFLFNSLSSLRALVRINQKKAEEMILQISKFLRYSLVSKKNNQVLLREELEAIGHYFEIERVRFGEKLITQIDVDPKANEFLIPSFLIHPIIENAIKYGMDSSTMPLKINLIAKVAGSVLQLDIINTGHWIDESKSNSNNGTGTGIGLKNVKQRLDLAFPNRNSFDIIRKENSVHIKIIIEKE
ncbi:sensor histidine kinase [Candidatus Neomarinimicrobiota bacterium]